MVLDIDSEGKLIGSELSTLEIVTLEVANRILEDYGIELLDTSNLKPWLVAKKVSRARRDRSAGQDFVSAPMTHSSITVAINPN